MFTKGLIGKIMNTQFTRFKTVKFNLSNMKKMWKVSQTKIMHGYFNKLNIQ